MKTLAALAAIVVVASCAAEPEPATSQTEQHSTYCNAPIYIECYPYAPGGNNRYCDLTCQTFDGVNGLCPEYNQTEIDWCEFHPGAAGCYGSMPHFTHHCITGAFF